MDAADEGIAAHAAHAAYEAREVFGLGEADEVDVAPGSWQWRLDRLEDLQNGLQLLHDVGRGRRLR